MKEFIKQQLVLHPSITQQDAVKMCFQAAYGAEHLLTDITKARDYFLTEFEACGPSGVPVAEFIAPEVCRVNLAAWKRLALPWEWLFNLFVESAKVPMPTGDDLFFEYVNEWSSYARDNGLGLAFSFAGQKPQPVHHSGQYREAEKPAYRVISGAYTRLVPILAALSLGEPQSPVQNKNGIIAIDGRAASGKSTLAGGLKAVIGAEVIHMDDFFLPAELRTPERLAEPGGNIHYERFAEEVLPYIRMQDAFEYKIFDCSTMSCNGTRKVPPSHWRVVEGAYSQHPNFGDYMTLRVFSDVDPQTQMERIVARNGPQMAEMFANKWIPMEEKYFSEGMLSCTSKTIFQLKV